MISSYISIYSENIVNKHIKIGIQIYSADCALRERGVYFADRLV